MAEDDANKGKGDQKPSDSKGSGEGGAFKVGDLRKMVNDLVQDAVKGAGTKEDSGKSSVDSDDKSGVPTGFQRGTMRAEVEREIARVKEREERVAKDNKIDETLTALQKATEKVPVERRRVHKFMRWGE